MMLRGRFHPRAVEDVMVNDDTEALERMIQRLLEECRRAMRSGRTGQARRDLDGAAALRRIVEGSRS